MAAPSLARLQELPPDQLGVVDDPVEIVVIAQRLLHSLRVGSDLAAVQRVDRVLAVVEPGEDRRELVGERQYPRNRRCRTLVMGRRASGRAYGVEITPDQSKSYGTGYMVPLVSSVRDRKRT